MRRLNEVTICVSIFRVCTLERDYERHSFTVLIGAVL